MASGDTLATFRAPAGEPPSANQAELVQRNRHFLLEFDAATDEATVFSGDLPASYAGTTGITVSLRWSAETATSGNVVWDVSIERIQDYVTDLDGDSFSAVNSITVATASASGELSYDDVTFTDGADMDSLAAEESFRIKVNRDANNGSDTMADGAQIRSVVITET